MSRAPRRRARSSSRCPCDLNPQRQPDARQANAPGAIALKKVHEALFIRYPEQVGVHGHIETRDIPCQRHDTWCVVVSRRSDQSSVTAEKDRSASEQGRSRPPPLAVGRTAQLTERDTDVIGRLNVDRLHPCRSCAHNILESVIKDDDC
jgi:hypothetical protein